jgi:hypothetical protein
MLLCPSTTLIRRAGGVEVKIHIVWSSAVGGGVIFTLRQLYPEGKEAPVLFGWETGWVPGPLLTSWCREIYLSLQRIEFLPVPEPTGITNNNS